MKKLLIPILLSVLMISCTSEATIDYEKESKEIHGVIESMFDAIAAIDLEALKTSLCDDFMAYDMNQLMKFEDLGSAVEGIREMGLTDLKYMIEPVEYYIFEKNAVAVVNTKATARVGEMDLNMDFMESYLLVKTENGWRIKFFHSTQLPTPEQP